MAGRREESSAESRRRLLEAATELVAEVGPRGTSVQAVAERAGISRGSIAWHFGSKDGLIVEVVTHAFATAEQEYRKRIAEAGTVTLGVLIDAHLAVVDAPCGRTFATVLPEVMLAPGPIRDAYVAGYQNSRRFWVDAVREVTADAPGMPDPATLADVLFGSAIGVNVMHRLDAGVDPGTGLGSLQQVFQLALDKSTKDATAS
ncbi:TetR/AcrR family transcriptional regulator [Nocardia iowensis]|uniref:TetR/AcrR family transcriptional regulator n=1 Tax=Nocardia iowensis TaxID=204891 RepID=A0ABX8S223_NOCIO|nr:TetR/AcrR family transcriptional regulator [Nocardia iowensis]QXN95104.1 TetR/AcrR family transcriptional regulator [Nocardia iowensis]